MTVKVSYDAKTTLVKGYYSDAINYPDSIPEPYIEISDQDHQAALGSQMCVVNGVFQEYVVPDAQLLANAIAAKITELNKAKEAYQFQDITLEGVAYSASKTACQNLTGAITIMTANNLPSIPWLDANDNQVILTLAQAQALGTAMFIQQSTAYMKEATFLAAINACKTIADVEALTFSFK